MIRICIHCIRIETDENPIIHRYVGHDAWHCRWSGSECVLIVPRLVLTCLTWCLPQLWQVCTTNMLFQQSNMHWRFYSHVLPVGKWCNVSLKSLCNIVCIIWSRPRARHPPPDTAGATTYQKKGGGNSASWPIQSHTHWGGGLADLKAYIPYIVT